mmetsp:Transcript_44565/g.107526  ORF Transcript_44565/g.107526 Transcript_44565/m.107526 type:complete len:310 (-) Transcript_44565:651-1580(-)
MPHKIRRANMIELTNIGATFDTAQCQGALWSNRCMAPLSSVVTHVPFRKYCPLTALNRQALAPTTLQLSPSLTSHVNLMGSNAGEPRRLVANHHPVTSISLGNITLNTFPSRTALVPANRVTHPSTNTPASAIFESRISSPDIPPLSSVATNRHSWPTTLPCSLTSHPEEAIHTRNAKEMKANNTLYLKEARAAAMGFATVIFHVSPMSVHAFSNCIPSSPGSLRVVLLMYLSSMYLILSSTRAVSLTPSSLLPVSSVATFALVTLTLGPPALSTLTLLASLLLREREALAGARSLSSARHPDTFDSAR